MFPELAALELGAVAVLQEDFVLVELPTRKSETRIAQLPVLVTTIRSKKKGTKGVSTTAIN